MLTPEDIQNLYRLASTAQIQAGQAIPVAILLQKTEQYLKSAQKLASLEEAREALKAEAKSKEKQPTK
jgi:hypothetical protein